MSARSFRSVGWVAGVGAAALGCYMLSLQVAAERADLSGVEARIVRTKQAIRDLQTELGTRGRLSQLENWNAEVLALSAPVADQFVENEVVLARLETPTGEFGDGAQLRMASAETAPAAPAAPAPVAQPQVRTAVATVAAAPERPVVRRASLAAAPPAAAERPVATPARTEPGPAASRAEARPAAARTAPPVRAAALLDERTTRQIGEAARAESRRTTAATPTAARERSEPRPVRTADKN